MSLVIKMHDLVDSLLKQNIEFVWYVTQFVFIIVLIYLARPFGNCSYICIYSLIKKQVARRIMGVPVVKCVVTQLPKANSGSFHICTFSVPLWNDWQLSGDQYIYFLIRNVSGCTIVVLCFFGLLSLVKTSFPFFFLHCVQCCLKGSQRLFS